MMKPDFDNEHRSDAPKDQSSPSRRFQYPRKDAIETTSQMHTLDYNHDNLQDEYYNIAAMTSSVSNSKLHQPHERLHEENVASITTTSNQRTKDSYNSKNGWFSLPWSKNSHTSTNQHQQQQHRTSSTMTSVNEESNLHDPINTITTDQINQYDDDIVPSSPKRRARKFNLLESTMIPESYSKVKMILQSESNHDDTNDDTTTTTTTARTGMEYSPLHEPQQAHYTTSSTGNSISKDPPDDCSFFFRSDESDYNSHKNPRPSQQQQHHEWKTIRRDHYKRHNSGQSIMYEYSDAVAVTPMPILQQYRTKFAQLNSELITERGDRRHRYPQHHDHQQQLPPPPQPYRYFDYNDHDHHHVVLEQQRDPFDDWHMQQSSLQLQEYDSTTTTTMNSNSNELVPESLPYYNANNSISRNGVQLSTVRLGRTTHGIVRSDTARQSSLFFMADGRILMRLPRDRVRLLVDPDLEVGVLSVEQWRVATDIESNNETTDYTHDVKSNLATDRDTDKSSEKVPQRNTLAKMEENESATPLPELRYVLTVSDDLYRKIVEEMSPTNIKYFCCTRGCCNDEEKVDIRIAFVLFGMTLLILFVNMLAFREH